MVDDRLRQIVERIERLMEERRGISDDIRDVFNEAKAVGYDAATIRKLITRRAMKPDDRAECDMLLESYEAALGGMREPIEPTSAEQRAAEMAHALLAEQIAGLEDPEMAALLVEHVTFLIDLRAEIAVLRQQEADRRKVAKVDGLQVNQLAAVVRWIEKCAKHGADVMRAGEATYLMYRGTVEARDAADDPAQVTGDATLAAKFAKPPPKKITVRDKRLAETMLWAGGRG